LKEINIKKYLKSKKKLKNPW